MNIIDRMEEVKNSNLFNERKSVGSNLVDIIRNKGYTKSSFSKIVDISRPTLDKLINGEIENKTTFISHITKIINKGIVEYDELLEDKKFNNNMNLVTLYSDNAPNDYVRTEATNELFMILDDLINLSELYN